MRIVVGTYDGGLLGWETDPSEPSGRALRLAYAFGAHDSSVKAVAIDGGKGNTLVTGAGDENMRVYSLKGRREVGTLSAHSDAITAIEFFGSSNMLSGSKDGTICIWRASDWTNLELMRGHKGAVNGLSIHPSGRLALSVSADKTLRLWDLTKGRPAYSTPLPSEGLVVRWSEDGSLYAVMFEGAVAVHDGATGAQRTLLRPPPGVRLLDMTLFNAPNPPPKSKAGSSSSSTTTTTLIAVGCEGGDLRVWDAGGAWCSVVPTGHARRVRAVAFTDALTTHQQPGGGAGAGASSSSSSSEAPTVELHPLSKMSAAASTVSVLTSDGPFLVTVDSEALVKLWDVRALVPPKPAAAPGSSSSGGSRVPETKLEGVQPAGVLTSGSNPRATALAATRLRAFVQSEMKGHEAAATAEAAAASAKPVHPQPSKSKSHAKEGKAAGKKRRREDVKAAPPVDATKGATLQESSSASPDNQNRPHRDGRPEKKAKGPVAFSFGFNVNVKEKHRAPTQDQKAPVASSSQPSAQPAAAPAEAAPAKKAKGVRFVI